MRYFTFTSHLTKIFAAGFCVFGLIIDCGFAQDKLPKEFKPSAAAEVNKAAASAKKPQLMTYDAISEALLTPCPEIDIKDKASLGETLHGIFAHIRQTSGIPLTYVLDYPELQLEGIKSIADVTINTVTVPAGTHTCGEVLSLLLRQTQDPQLALHPTRRHMQLTTKAKAESDGNLYSRLYDVKDLLITSPDTDRPDISALIDLIYMQTSPPARWTHIDGEGGALSAYGQYLTIRQTAGVHAQIADIFQLLRDAIAKGGPPIATQGRPAETTIEPAADATDSTILKSQH